MSECGEPDQGTGGRAREQRCSFKFAVTALMKAPALTPGRLVAMYKTYWVHCED
jgi:hypothetical protein